MAANEYYNPSASRLGHRVSDPPSPPHSPSLYSQYTSQNTHPSAPSIVSSLDDSRYRPYAESNGHHTPSPYYASGGGGREHEPSAYADDIPLRQHTTKHDSDTPMHDPLPDDPAIIDRPRHKTDRRKRKQGWFRGKIPWAVYTLTLVQICVFIAELAKSGQLTKTPIEVKPQFNPMIGPSPYIQINMGARYVPCMKKTSVTLEKIQWPCPNITSSSLDDPSYQCGLHQLCGFGDKAYDDKHLPNQWYRFIIPIFLHGGFIHITINMLLQLLLGRQMELEIGTLRFVLVYISSGIFGFVLGGNFAPEGIASTGASGALFGIIALLLLDLIFHWGERKSPVADLAWLVGCIIICFVLGLLPGLDNFAHIGGFLMGLVLGICILHSPEVLRRRVGADLPPYASVHRSRGRADDAPTGVTAFIKEPSAFFKGRKPLWWAWWLVRAAALVGVFIFFILLLKNFYDLKRGQCHWCRYLSCINIKNWCDVGQLTTTNVTKSPSKRDVFVGPIPISLQDLL